MAFLAPYLEVAVAILDTQCFGAPSMCSILFVGPYGWRCVLFGDARYYLISTQSIRANQIDAAHRIENANKCTCLRSSNLPGEIREVISDHRL